jgi:hypothetical protein
MQKARVVECDAWNKHAGIEPQIRREDYSRLDNEFKKKISGAEKCAPGKSLVNGSCFSLEVVVDMAKAYNKSLSAGLSRGGGSVKRGDAVAAQPIQLGGSIVTDPSSYRHHLLRELRDRLKSICKDELCWLKQDFIRLMNSSLRDEATKFTHRPKGPDGRFTWLSTTNIDEVMEQYEVVHNDFKFVGTFPVDFDDIHVIEGRHENGISERCIKSFLKMGKRKMGYVFNLDEHYKSGSHWVSLWCDLDTAQVSFFDSYGEEPDERIETLMKRIAKVFQDFGGKRVTVDWNKTRHQFENSECGVYSINFLVRMLNGKKFVQLTKNRVYDLEVNVCRTVYFQ